MSAIFRERDGRICIPSLSLERKKRKNSPVHRLDLSSISRERSNFLQNMVLSSCRNAATPCSCRWESEECKPTCDELMLENNVSLTKRALLTYQYGSKAYGFQTFSLGMLLYAAVQRRKLQGIYTSLSFSYSICVLKCFLDDKVSMRPCGLARTS